MLSSLPFTPSFSFSLFLDCFATFGRPSTLAEVKRLDKEWDSGGRLTKKVGISAKSVKIRQRSERQDTGGKWWIRAGRMQALRAPPQINISFQPRQPPTERYPSLLPVPLLFHPPLYCLLPPFVFCRFSLASSRVATELLLSFAP